jgi:hypothetical protein
MNIAALNAFETRWMMYATVALQVVSSRRA